LAAAQRKAVGVSYPDRIPDSTKTLSITDLASAAVSSGQTTITFDPAPSDVHIAVGDVLVAGVTSTTRSGLLRKVTSVSESGTKLRVTTVAATIVDAVPQGSFAESGTFDTRTGTTTASARSHADATSTILGDVLGSVGTETVSCGAGRGTLSVTPHLENAFNQQFKASWDGPGLGGINAFGRIGETAAYSATVTSDGSGSCSANKSLLKGRKLGPPIPIPIPGLAGVFSVQPTLSVDLSVSYNVTQALSYSVSRSHSWTASYTVAHGVLTAVATHRDSGLHINPPSSDSIGNIAVTLTPHLDFLIKAAVGPSLGPSLGVDAGLNMAFENGNGPPTWQLSAQGDATVGLHFEFLGIQGELKQVLVPGSVVLAASAPKIADETFAPVTAGSPTTEQLTAYGGPEGPCSNTRVPGQCQYIWTITNPSTPSWVTVTSDGVVSFDPPADTPAGPVTFTVAVTDDAKTAGIPIPTSAATRTFTVDVTAVLRITPPSLRDGTNGRRFFATLGATGGTTPYTWARTSGNLPDGLSLDGVTGTISGIPTTPGDSTFQITVTDSKGVTAHQTYDLTVNSNPLTITSPSVNTATVGEPFSVTLSAAGGTTPYTWVRTSGNLPDGLRLDAATGTISGIPTTPGDSTFQITVVDPNHDERTQIYDLTVGTPSCAGTCAIALGNTQLDMVWPQCTCLIYPNGNNEYVAEIFRNGIMYPNLIGFADYDIYHLNNGEVSYFFSGFTPGDSVYFRIAVHDLSVPFDSNTANWVTSNTAIIQ
jgi:hypothetical protein